MRESAQNAPLKYCLANRPKDDDLLNLDRWICRFFARLGPAQGALVPDAGNQAAIRRVCRRWGGAFLSRRAAVLSGRGAWHAHTSQDCQLKHRPDKQGVNKAPHSLSLRLPLYAACGCLDSPSQLRSIFGCSLFLIGYFDLKPLSCGKDYLCMAVPSKIPLSGSFVRQWLTEEILSTNISPDLGHPLKGFGSSLNWRTFECFSARGREAWPKAR